MAEQDPANEPEDASVSDENEETADVMTPSGADEAETVGAVRGDPTIRADRGAGTSAGQGGGASPGLRTG